MNKSNTSELSIFINTFDSYSDCWAPCLDKLLANFEAEYESIFINNSSGVLRAEADNVVYVYNDDTLAWSDYLAAGLLKVQSEFVLYLQEDYFIEESINAETIQLALDTLSTNRDIACVHLTSQGPIGTTTKHSDRLNIYCKTSRYLFSTQLAVWRRVDLLKLLLSGVDGWSQEFLGTWRLRFSKLRVAGVTSSEATAYIHTGIIKGKWHKDAVNLLANQYEIDFSRRGVYQAEYPVVRKLKAGWHLLRVIAKRIGRR